MHILDGLISSILRQVFYKMKSASEDDVVARTHMDAMVDLNDRIAAAKTECARANKEYESLKNDVIKAVQGQSKFQVDLLSELVDSARTKMLVANEKLCELNAELEQSNSKIGAIKDDYRRIIEWSQIFDASDMAVKKMIAGYIIKQVNVHSGYRLNLEFNINFAQFELGLDIQNDHDTRQHTA